MKLSQQAVFWLGTLVLFIGFVWLFKPVLMPFVLGAGVAYFLNPVVNKLGGWKLSRAIASGIILLFFLMIVVLLGLLIVPLLAREVSGFVQALPSYLETLNTYVGPHIEMVRERFGITGTEEILAKVQENSGTIFAVVENILNRLLASGSAIFSWLSFVVLMPVVAFYMMRDWPKLSATLDDLWPRQHAKTIRELLKEIDATISAFVRGQLLVAFSLGIFYGIALTLLGLEYGFFVGFTAGLLGIIPYLGSILGLVASTALAWVQFGAFDMVGFAAAIFVVGQAVEGNFLTPKLVGDKVGLHALWVIFALMAGGSLLGFTGLLIAVPFAAVIGVMLRFTLKQYKNSQYYK